MLVDINSLPIEALVALARYSSDLSILEYMQSHDDIYEVALGLADNMNSSENILLNLISLDYIGINESVAQHPNASVKILNILSKNEASNIRWHVARNPNTSVEILALLAKDTDIHNRYTVAMRIYKCEEILNNHIEILKQLTFDTDESVKKIAINKLAKIKGLSSFI